MTFQEYCHLKEIITYYKSARKQWKDDINFRIKMAENQNPDWKYIIVKNYLEIQKIAYAK